MLDQRHRRWANIELTLGHRHEFGSDPGWQAGRQADRQEGRLLVTENNYISMKFNTINLG